MLILHYRGYKMKDYREIDLNELPEVQAKDIRCLYFLFKNKELVYIGKSINLFGRIGNHLMQKNKVFDSFRYLEVPDLIDLEELERIYIVKYRPIYNVQIKTKYEQDLISSQRIQEREELRRKKRELEEKVEEDFLSILSSNSNITISENV